MNPLDKIFENNPSLKEINKHFMVKSNNRRPVIISKSKIVIEDLLKRYCTENGYTLLTEHRFHEARKFRFDWAIPEKKWAFEYEGLNSAKSRHTTKGGFTTDTTKYNLAQSLGWSVFRYTSRNYLEIENLLK